MNQTDIDRINELSKLSKERELSPEEKDEQQTLRKAYIESWKQATKCTLDNTYIEDCDGNRTKLQKKKK